MGADKQVVQHNSNAGRGGGVGGYMEWTNIQLRGNNNSFNHLMRKNPVLGTTVRSNGAKTSHLFFVVAFKG